MYRIHNEIEMEGSKPLTADQMEEITFQLNNCICKVYQTETNVGTGFFCLLPNPDIRNTLPVLITNNHVLGEKDLEKEEIMIEMNKTKDIKYLSLNNRKTFTNVEVDVTIIEIIPDLDNLDMNKNFLEIDKDALIEDYKHLEKQINIYVLHIPKGIVANFSQGEIYKIEGNIIKHKCTTDCGSSGGAIICLSHHKVIGIHRGWDKEKKEEKGKGKKNAFRINVGTLIKTVIKLFNKKNTIKKDDTREKGDKCLTVFPRHKNYKNNDNFKAVYSNNNNKTYIHHKIENNDDDDDDDDDIINIIEMVLENNNDFKDLYFLCKDYTKIYDKYNPELYINNVKKNKYDNHYEFLKGKYSIKIVFYGAITDCSNMFKDCQNLTEINLSSFNTDKVTNMSSMFCNCKNLSKIYLSNLNTEKVTDMSRMFQNCNNLSTINLSNFNTENVINMSQMFHNCNNLSSIDLSNFDTQNVTNMEKMFLECESVKTIIFSNYFNTMKVTKMFQMFNFCRKLEQLDLASFNTKNVVNMAEMFSTCSSLQNINLSSFNTKNVEKMNKMFESCTSLKTIQFSNRFNTEKVKTMNKMFMNCQNLEELNLSSFKTENVIKMNEMFYSCNTLESLDLSSFNINKVKSAKKMFENCNQLMYLNLKNFNIKVDENFEGFFSKCNRLEEIYVSKNINDFIINNLLRDSRIKAKIIKI